MDNIERWRKIPRWPYEVSDRGRVRRLEANRGTFSGRVLSQDEVHNGYRRVKLFRGGKGKHFRVHRLVLRVFVGPCPEGHEADHINGDQRDNRLENLRWLPRRENREPKLDEEDVLAIRRRYARGKATQAELADEYGVYPNAIRKVIVGETWADVGGFDEETPDA